MSTQGSRKTSDPKPPTTDQRLPYLSINSLKKKTSSSALSPTRAFADSQLRARSNSVEDLRKARSYAPTPTIDPSQSQSNGDSPAQRLTNQPIDRKQSLEQINKNNKELDDLLTQLSIENKIKEGAENLLQTFDQSTKDSQDALRKQVELKLDQANSKISQLKKEIEAYKSLPGASRSPVRRRRNIPGAENGSPKVAIKRKPQLHLVNTELNGPSKDGKSPATSLSEYLDALADLDGLENSRAQRLEKLALVANLLRVHKSLSVDSIPKIMQVLVHYLTDSKHEMRSAAYRVICHLVTNISSIVQVRQYKIDFFIVRSLSRDGIYNQEKEYALKLVRTCAEIPGGTKHVSKAVMRAIIAIAEHADDKLKGLCLETLSEFLVRDAQIVSISGGMRSLLQTLIDGPIEFSEYLMLVFMHVIDTPKKRVYIRPGSDFEVILSGFTDAYARNATADARLKDASRILSIMLKQWPGLFYLFMNDRQSIRALVGSLRIPENHIRDILLDFFFDIFNIKPPSWYPTFLAGRRLTVYGRPKSVNMDDIDDGQPTRSSFPERPNLVDHYISLLLLVFIEAGLFDALIEVVEGGDKQLISKATLLIGEVLHLCSRLLPSGVDYGVNVQSLPRLFKLAAGFEDEPTRHMATSALLRIDNLNRTRNRIGQNNQSNGRERSASTGEDQKRRGQRQVEQVKIRMGMNIDDTHFRNLLLETQVLHTKDHTKWNWETLTELVQGPLRNPRRLEEAIRASKFMKRLMSFYRPYNRRFSEIKKTKPNQRYVRLGCSLITTLLSNADGVRYLADNKILRQIADGLNQLDPLLGTQSADALFSKRRIQDTLSSGYFTMLGTLSKSIDGIKMMEQHNIFSTFYHLSELHSRDDLIKAIVTNLDYSLGGHPRIILSKALTSGYKAVRHFATRYLGVLMRDPANKANDWGIKLLITQLYDPAMEVCEMAVRVLEEACDEPANLEAIVSLRPSLDHLGEAGNPLLLRFLSTSIGFQYLDELDFIEREMDEWYSKHNLQYVVQVELALARNNGPDDVWDDEQDAALLGGGVLDGSAPPHFYGELSKTEEGRQLLRKKGHFESFCDYVRLHGLEDLDTAIIGKLKAVLWSVGNIGASEGGLPFLERENIIPQIVNIAENSSVFSIKGTAFFVLGLIANTTKGIVSLEQHGWEGIRDTFGKALGLVVPRNVDQFLKVESWNSNGVSSEGALDQKISLRYKSMIERIIIQNLADLSNHILANNASKNLSKLKIQHRESFSDMHTYRNALKLLEHYSFRLPVRRFIIELFDVPLSMATYETMRHMDQEEAVKEATRKSSGSREPSKESRGADSLDSPSQLRTMSIRSLSAPSVPGIQFGHRLSAVFDDSDDEIEDGSAVLQDEKPKELLEPQNTVRGFVV